MKLRDRSNRNTDKVDNTSLQNTELKEQIQSKKMTNKKKKHKPVSIKEEAENDENSFKMEEKHSESKYFSESKTEEDNLDGEIEPVKLKKNYNKKVQRKEDKSQPKQTSSKTSNKSSRKPSSHSKKTKEEELEIKNENNSMNIAADNDDDDDDEDSGDDWEEVEMAPCETIDVAISKETLQFTVDTKKQKKPTDLKAKMERMFKMMQKKLGVCIIKTHLLCWLNHGFYLNALVLDPLVRAFHLSMNQFQPPNKDFELKKLDEKYLVRYLKTINSLLEIKSNEEQFLSSNILVTKDNLIEALTKAKCENYLQYVLLVLVSLRNLGVKARLCVCFDVYSFKEETKLTRKQPQKRKPHHNSDSDSNEEDLDFEEQPTTSKRSTGLRKQTKRIKKEIKESSSESEDSFDEDYKVERKKKISTTSNKASKSQKKIEETIKIEPVDDVKKKLIKSSKSVKNNKILSEDDQNETKDVKVEQVETIEVAKKTDHRHYWLEVYLEKEKQWCSIEPYTLKISDDPFFENRYGQRILYVCSYDNENRVKDVTKRYADEWATNVRLLRVNHLDEKKLWWEATLLKRQPLDANLDIQEEIQLKSKLLFFLTLIKSFSKLIKL